MRANIEVGLDPDTLCAEVARNWAACAPDPTDIDSLADAPVHIWSGKASGWITAKLGPMPLH